LLPDDHPTRQALIGLWQIINAQKTKTSIEKQKSNVIILMPHLERLRYERKAQL
jgi:hypothetical protein